MASLLFSFLVITSVIRVVRGIPLDLNAIQDSTSTTTSLTLTPTCTWPSDPNTSLPPAGVLVTLATDVLVTTTTSTLSADTSLIASTSGTSTSTNFSLDLPTTVSISFLTATEDTQGSGSSGSSVLTTDSATATVSGGISSTLTSSTDLQLVSSTTTSSTTSGATVPNAAQALVKIDTQLSAESTGNVFTQVGQRLPLETLATLATTTQAVLTTKILQKAFQQTQISTVDVYLESGVVSHHSYTATISGNPMVREMPTSETINSMIQGMI